MDKKIKRSSSRKRVTPEQRRRKKIIQITAGIVLIGIIIFLAFTFHRINPNGGYVWLIGIAFGYVLQRSRFCFTAAMRDPMLTGGTMLTKAVIIALTLSSIGFMAINMSKFGLNMQGFELSMVAGNVQPLGINTAIGAFLFGIGAVIAGGCASGTLMRMGEGFAQQWLVFLFFIVGAVIGAVIMVPMSSVPVLRGTPVFLPAALGGWVPAVILQFGLLAIVYLLAHLWGNKKSSGVI
jgi:uncharacterized protein